MAGVLGVVLLIAAVSRLVSAFRRRAGAAVPARRGPSRAYLAGGIAAVVAGGLLLAWPAIAMTRMTSKGLSWHESWSTNPPAGPEAPIRWEGQAVDADLEVGSSR